MACRGFEWTHSSYRLLAGVAGATRWPSTECRDADAPCGPAGSSTPRDGHPVDEPRLEGIGIERRDTVLRARPSQLLSASRFSSSLGGRNRESVVGQSSVYGQGKNRSSRTACHAFGDRRRSLIQSWPRRLADE